MKRNSVLQNRIIRWGLIAVLLVLWASQVHADRIISQASFDTLSATMTEGLDPAVYPVREVTAAGRYFGLDPSLFENITLYRNEDAMSAQEMLIARFNSPEAAEALEEAIEKRIDSQHSIYEGYAPEQAAMMEDALVDVQGNYGLYYVGNDPQGVDARFHQALAQKGGSE